MEETMQTNNESDENIEFGVAGRNRDRDRDRDRECDSCHQDPEGQDLDLEFLF